MPDKLIIFPCGGNARESLAAIESLNSVKKRWDVIGFIDDDPAFKGRECCGVKVLGGRDVLKKHPEASVLAVPGSPSNYKKRKEIIGSLGIEGGRFATIIDAGARVAADAAIGRNSLIMSGVFISSNVRIGNNCLILPNTSIMHDAVIGDYTCVGANVTISGNAVIGELCYIGSGSRIREKVRVGSGSLVGMGANVLKDAEPGVVVVGNPARVLRRTD